MEVETFIKIAFGIFFLGSLALFNSGEISFLSLGRLSIQKLKLSYPKKAKYFTRWEVKPDDILIGLLIWQTIFSIAIGVISVSIGLDVSEKFGREEFIWIVPIISTLLVLVFAEILPKVFSRFHSEMVSKTLAPIIFNSNKLLKPLMKLLLNLARKLHRMLFGKYSPEGSFLTEHELKIIFEKEKVLTHQEKKFMKNILDFGEKRVSEVLTPASKMVAIDIDEPLEEIFQKIKFHKYSRFPVYREDINNLVGILYIKDLLVAMRKTDNFLLDDILRPVHYIPENAKISELLKEFKKGRYHIAIVVDEHGSIVGLVTIEDLLEEVAGEIYDEYEVPKETIVRLSDGSWLIDADENIKNVNEKLGIEIKPKDCDTLGGFLLEIYGRIPQAGEKFDYNGIKFEVISSDQRKIEKIKLTKHVNSSRNNR